MKKSIKVTIIIAIIMLVLAFLLIPQKSTYQDGGTEIYRALLYTIKKPYDLIDGPKGTIVEILGFTVYNDTEPKTTEQK